MAVYFVHRSQYFTPTLNYQKKFEVGTLLEWFQAHWIPIADWDAAREYVRDTFGIHVYEFDGFFRTIAESKLAPPKDTSEMVRTLQKSLSYECEAIVEEHHVQVLTNDDELDFAYYFFDDEYIATHAGNETFLLSDWTLPEEYSETTFTTQEQTKQLVPQAQGDGTTYCVFLSYYCAGGNIEDIQGTFQINGARVPDLPEYLGRNDPYSDLELEHWPPELLLLRSQLLLLSDAASAAEKALTNALISDYKNPAAWKKHVAALSTLGIEKPEHYILGNALKECAKLPVHWFTEEFNWRGERVLEWIVDGQNLGLNVTEMSKLNWSGVNNPDRSLVQLSDHMIQASINTDEWDDFRETQLYNRWIIFDDLWASANPVLANCILRYGMRWDVL